MQKITAIIIYTIIAILLNTLKNFDSCLVISSNISVHINNAGPARNVIINENIKIVSKFIIYLSLL